MPVARVMKPNDYLTERRKLDERPETYGQRIPAWGELERLIYVEGDRAVNLDEELWHPFDIEFKNSNQFLLKPTKGDFQPWSSFWSQGGGVEHYYHYWQIYQVHAIQHYYPIFAKHNWILEALSGEPEYRVSSLKPLQSEPMISLQGKIHCFDALSFYIQLTRSEWSRTFAPSPDSDPNKRISDEQIELYSLRQKYHAELVGKKYALKQEELYQFMMDLLELQDTYRRSEKTGLAEELTKDLLVLRRMLAHIANTTVENMSTELGKRGLFFVNQFRHLDENLEMADCVKEYFTRMSKEYNSKFPNHKFSETEINSLWEFVFSEDLILLPYSIFSLHRTLNELRGARKLSLYVDIKNLTTSFEYFIREVGRKSGDPETRKILDNPRMNTLRPLIRETMKGETWLALFTDKNFKKLGHATRPQHFIRNIFILLNDATFDQSQENGIAKAFLLAEIGRNLTVHSFTYETALYTELRGQIFTSVIYAMFYVWQRARKKNWVE